MKKYLPLLLLSLFFASCKKQEKANFKPSFASVTIDTLLKDSISIRALTIDGDKVWYAGSKGKYGWVSLSGGKNFTGVASQDTIYPEFRSIAQTKENVFILSVGSPALLFRISKDGKQSKLMFTDNTKDVFFDCLKIDGKSGIALGDPMFGTPDILTTIDGGATWKRTTPSLLPKFEKGEAAFAASNSNIVVREGKTWMVSGGKKSRLFVLENQKWDVYDTPIIQSSESTGAYSMDFYDNEIGFIAGGDYTKPNGNNQNKALTTDGGKTWTLVANGAGPGYISCVQFVPGGNGNELVTTGGDGVFYSFDRGATWKKILEDKDLHSLQFVDAKTLIAAGQNRIVRIKLK